LERALAVALILRERRGDPRMVLAVEDGRAVLRVGGEKILAWPTGKRPRETVWDLSVIALRGGTT